MSNLGSWTGIADFLVRHESHPPLYYWLLRAWGRLTPSSDLWAMVPSLTAGTVAVPLAWWVGRELWDRWAAIGAALLVAVSPALVRYSTMVRPYMIVGLLALLSNYLVWRFTADRGVKGQLAGYVLVTAAMLYLHNWSSLIVIGQWGAVALLWWNRSEQQRRRRLVRRWLIAQVVVGGLYLPWLPLFLEQAQSAGYGPTQLSAVGSILWGIFSFLSGSFSAPFYTEGLTPLPLDGLAQTTLLLVPVAGLLASCWPGLLQPDTDGPLDGLDQTKDATAGRSGGRGKQTRQPSAGPGWVLGGGPLLVLAAAVPLSHISNLLAPHLFLVLAPSVLVAATGGLSRLRPVFGRSGYWFLVGLVAAVSLGAIVTSTSRHSNAREAAIAIQAQAASSDLVVVAPASLGSSFLRYLPQRYNVTLYPPQEPRTPKSYSGRWGRYNAAGPYQRVEKRMRAAQSAGRPTWLVTLANHLKASVGKRNEFDDRDSRLIPWRIHQIRDFLDTLYPHSCKPLSLPPAKEEQVVVLVFADTPSVCRRARTSDGSRR